MENNMKTKKNSKALIAVLVSIIIVLLLVAAGLLWLVVKNWDVIDLSFMKEISVSNQESSLTVGTPDDTRESIEISTKYGTFFYPKEWESNLRIEIIDEDIYKVEFYGTIEGKDEHQLFDLIFNGTEGYNLGTLTTESGEDVSINIVSYDFELDNTWTEDEQIVLFSMQEDINYIIGMLSESGNFTVS